MKLAGKKALVTGAADGIGFGCARQLAAAGADVAINDLSPSARSEAALSELRVSGRSAVFVAGDVFSREGCAEVFAQALAALDRIDILVSNPAFSRRGDFLDYDADVFERTLAGTLTGGFHMSQLVARHMVERGGRGKIIFISSVHAAVPYARAVAYNAAKSGLNHMARTIATELLPHRINVNIIEPGWIDTPGEHASFGTAAIAAAAPTLPWGRLGTMDDIGRAAAFLASDDADYITGTSLRVDGGFTLRAAMATGLPPTQPAGEAPRKV